MSVGNNELDLSGNAPTDFEATRTSPVTVYKRRALAQILHFQAQAASPHRATSDVDLANFEPVRSVSHRTLVSDYFRTDSCNSFENRFGGGVRDGLRPALVSSCRSF